MIEKNRSHTQIAILTHRQITHTSEEVHIPPTSIQRQASTSENPESIEQRAPSS